MKIPLAYNLRNLAVRKTTTIMTAFGIGLTVAVLLAMLALVDGLRHALASSGDPLHVLVMRKGAQSELTSNFSRMQFQEVKTRPGIVRTASGEPMASLEMVTVIVLESPQNPSGTNLNLRGLLPVGIEMRRNLQITEGRWFTPGRRECVVGKSVADRHPVARVGSTLKFGRGQWTVVGVMSHGNSAIDSEIWADLNQLSADFQRVEVLSSALLRAPDAAGVDTLIAKLRADQRLNVDARTERSWYDSQTDAAMPLQFIGTIVAVIMAVGSSFAAMNTMYAGVARRSKEIGTLRVLGFSKSGILLSFVLESLLLSLLGSIVGIALVIPLNNLSTAVGSFTSFTEIGFRLRVTPAIVAGGVGFGVLMGVAGGLLPAFAAARKEILTALRES